MQIDHPAKPLTLSSLHTKTADIKNQYCSWQGTAACWKFTKGRGWTYVSIYSCESGSNKELPAVQEKENGVKV